jgi:hypothetical protein
MPNRDNPIGNTDETSLSRYDEPMARLQNIRVGRLCFFDLGVRV